MNELKSIFGIDWDTLFLELSKNTLFLNKKVNQQFFSDWKKLLTKLEDNFLSNVTMKASKIQSYPLVFMLPFENKKFEFQITLIIPRLNSELQKSNAVIRKVETKDFGTYIPYNADYNLKDFNSAPIIVLQEEIIKENFLVDGNHRVKYAKEHDISELDAYIIKSPFLINHPLSFGYHFHYAFYCFLLDYTHFNDIRLFHPLLRHFPFYEGYFYRKHSSKYWADKYSFVFEENPLPK